MSPPLARPLARTTVAAFREHAIEGEHCLPKLLHAVRHVFLGDLDAVGVSTRARVHQGKLRLQEIPSANLDTTQRAQFTGLG
ncbi:MAG TPA: hypothetical protein VMW56_31375 [Candidatus Margulisiibacteriota bacterium]|nr:hypothetical protein [Candidatus Margulisiibacteriota bacterium]